MDSFSDIIEAYGAKTLSDLLGVPDTHVRTMKFRNSIPVEHWPAIIAAPPAGQTITFDNLMRLRATRFASDAESAA
tara:strand:- start:46 stop:273 length:228 start_codon:yes stop_codon:yes gene_type:complete